ncbi:MAG: SagB/ThcOx family dehydrogenase [Anaerolineae bacterium]
MTNAKSRREYLKGDIWKELQGRRTDQQKGLPHPPLQKPYPEEATLIDLEAPENLNLGEIPLNEAIAKRQSRRKYLEDALSLEDLAFLLWATQGARKILSGGRAVFRTVPSAGARHPFETYLSIHRVANLPVGLYRYLSLDHKLCRLSTDPTLPQKLAQACHDQSFVAQSAVTFVWTALPYRTEWRYDVAAHKVIALDAGHVCQNLYLAAEGIGCGTCAIAAYNQKMVDALLDVDGEDEFAIYVAPVGKVE